MKATNILILKILKSKYNYTNQKNKIENIKWSFSSTNQIKYFILSVLSLAAYLEAILAGADNQYNIVLSNLKAIAFKITKVESEKNPLPISALFLELLQRQLK